MKQIQAILFFNLLVLLFFSCKRPDEKLTSSPNAKLSFSSDSLEFDTILATGDKNIPNIKSLTERLIVTNYNKNAIKISSIQLAGMANSNYRVIVNGIETFYTTDLEIRGGDSIYILVSLTVKNIQTGDLPYVLEDTLTFTSNGNIQKVKLVGYGQDANFIKGDSTLACGTIWDDAKPYVILKSVTVPVGCTLTIKKGVRIFSHDNAVIKINGTLLVEGEKDSANIVRFQGDKLGQSFRNAPGQWQGIVINPGSKNNSIKYAEIKNAVIGIQMNPEPDGDTIPELTLKNTTIRTITLYGIEAIATDLYVENSVIANCAEATMAGLGGGNYHFVYCTFADYSYDFYHQDPLFKLSKTYQAIDNTITSGEIKASVTNSIIWGDLTDELDLNLTNSTDFKPSYCFIKTTKNFAPQFNYLRVDPLFLNPQEYNFHPDSASTFNKGINYPGISEDLEGKPRNGKYTPGAYNK